MMRCCIVFIMALVICSCHSNEKKSSPVIAVADTAPNFFPVTSYLRGQLYEIKSVGITPVRKITINGKTDSFFVKMDSLPTVFAEFLNPVIDTANLKKDFTEKKFLDQTVNAFTFTYDPLNETSQRFPFCHWDVYVDPETNKVRRVYLVKNIAGEKQLQLTWQSGKWCKIVTLSTANNTLVKVKEEKITWSVEEQ